MAEKEITVKLIIPITMGRGEKTVQHLAEPLIPFPGWQNGKQAMGEKKEGPIRCYCPCCCRFQDIFQNVSVEGSKMGCECACRSKMLIG